MKRNTLKKYKLINNGYLILIKTLLCKETVRRRRLGSLCADGHSTLGVQLNKAFLLEKVDLLNVNKI